MVAPESLQAARTPARPLVLIIDEEETARDLYGHWFFAHGFEVMCAVGMRGLSFALRWERPQLIVTELRARDLTLHQLIARLRCDETSRCIPVIVVTTSCDPRALNAAKEAGATVVLPKLADFEGLQSWVTAHASDSLTCFRSWDNGQRFAYVSAVDKSSTDDTLVVNCGRCGKPLVVRLRDVRDKRTIDCSQCENRLPVREEAPLPRLLGRNTP